jgi:hypothetical protein
MALFRNVVTGEVKRIRNDYVLHVIEIGRHPLAEIPMHHQAFDVFGIESQRPAITTQLVFKLGLGQIWVPAMVAEEQRLEVSTEVQLLSLMRAEVRKDSVPPFRHIVLVLDGF